MSKIIFRFFMILLPGIIAFSCAQVGSPTGGPKDKTPPRIVSSIPENYSTNFNDDKFVIEFNEYVVLKDLNSKLIISPMLEEKPEIKIRGKKLVTDFVTQPDDSTTYTFWFDDAIQDLNENNPLKNYEYVFSTGEIIDSMQVAGTLVTAFGQKPVYGVWVMLYENFNDSTPIVHKPDYIARTDSSGNFKIRNIKKGSYHIFALKDANANYLFDLPNEKIAFSDTVFTTKSEVKQVRDTLQNMEIIKDSIPADTIWTDSVVVKQKTFFEPDSIFLNLFQEDYQKQYLSDDSRPEKSLMVFVFNRRLKDSLLVEIADTSITKKGLMTEYDTNHDSISVWIKDSTLFNRDTLTTIVHYPKLDSLGQDIIFTDTLEMVYKQESKKTPRGRRNQKKEEEKVDVMKFENNLNGGFLEDNTPLVLISEFPVREFFPEKMKLLKLEDTAKVPVDFKIIPDSVLRRKFNITANWEPASKYEFFIDTAAFYDLQYRTQDTLEISLKTREENYYAGIIINVDIEENPIMIQLLNEKEAVLREFFIEESKKLKIDYLQPKTYKLKAFIDKNKNQNWDTGNYLERKQPERVIFYPKEVETRSGFETEIDWSII